jgi:hypothetical protein
MTKDQKRKKYCSGCRDDFYNHSGNSNTGECWCLADAEVEMKKFVHIDQRPPWNQKAVKTLSCHRRPRHVGVGPDVIQ